MVAKSIPISFRATPEEADFLAQLQADGAVTFSNKLRWLIESARLRQAGSADAAHLRDLIEEPLQQALHRWRNAEAESGQSSALLRAFTEWLVEAATYFAMAGKNTAAGDRFLLDLEAGAADRVARLAEDFLRLGVTTNAPCYSPSVVRDRAGPVIELAHIIERQKQG